MENIFDENLKNEHLCPLKGFGHDKLLSDYSDGSGGLLVFNPTPH